MEYGVFPPSNDSADDSAEVAPDRERCEDCRTVKRKRMVRTGGLPGCQSAILASAALIIPVVLAEAWGDLSQQLALLSFIGAGVTLRLTHPRRGRRYVCPRCHPADL